MLEAVFPGEVSRLAGQDRYETGAIVAQFGDDSLLNWAAPSIATGDDFPDALAGGPHAARWLSPLIITPGDQLHPAAAAKLSEHKASVNWVWYLGGTSALSENVRSQVRGVLQ
jgi:thermitase